MTTMTELTREGLERKLEIMEKNYAELMQTASTIDRMNDALAKDIAEYVKDAHWAKVERDTMRSVLDDVKADNDRLRERLEKAEAAKMPDGVTAEDVAMLARIAENYFYDRLTFSKAMIYGRYTSENADFDEFVGEYVYPAGDLNAVGITRRWFIGYFHDRLEADYEDAKAAYAERKASEGGEDD